MRQSSTIAGFLVVVFLAALSSAPAWGFIAGQINHLPEHPAGCHHPLSHDRSPAPVNHRCCVAGHQAAILGTAFASQQLSGLSSVSKSDISSHWLDALSVEPRTSVVLHRTPGTSPLRI